MPGPACHLAIDQGGHASRALLFTADGALLASASAPVTTQRPRPGWVEHDPEALLASIGQAVTDALNAAPAANVVSAGLAIQRSSIVCWDRDSGRALSPVLSWQDCRNADWLAALALDADEVHRRTGLVISPHYGASKLRWCLDHLPAVRDARRQGRLCAGPLASFVLHRLLAERPFLVDPANASRTLLWDVGLRDWSAPMLAAFGVPRDGLPECVPSRHDFGTLIVGDRRIPLTIATGDQSAALFAWGEPAPDTLYINLGTGAFAQRAVGATPPEAPGLLRSVVWQDAGACSYVLEATVNGAGSALDWLAEHRQRPVSDLIAHAETWLAEPDAPPLFLNGVGGLGSPWWRPDCQSLFSAEGTLAGCTVAVIESIVFALCANIEIFRNAAGPLRRIRVSGGLARLDGLCRRLADLSGIAVERGAEVEASARGLAWLLAGADAPWPEPEPALFQPCPQASLHVRYRDWQSLLAQTLASHSTIGDA